MPDNAASAMRDPYKNFIASDILVIPAELFLHIVVFGFENDVTSEEYPENSLLKIVSTAICLEKAVPALLFQAELQVPSHSEDKAFSTQENALQEKK